MLLKWYRRIIPLEQVLDLLREENSDKDQYQHERQELGTRARSRVVALRRNDNIGLGALHYAHWSRVVGSSVSWSSVV